MIFLRKPLLLGLYYTTEDIGEPKLFKSNLERWEKEGLYLLYLPPYSPELNLIEILWREMKYRWVDIEALLSFDTLSVHIKKLLDGFGSEYVINFS